MKQSINEKYKNAKHMPDEPLFLISDVSKILKYSASESVMKFDEFLNLRKNSSGYRIYSYNDIEYLKNLKKLIDKNIPFEMLKILIEHAKKKGTDSAQYVQELIDFSAKYKYSKNRKKKTGV